LSSFIVAPSAVAMRDGAALRGRHLSFPYSFFLKNVVLIFELDHLFCFVVCPLYCVLTNVQEVVESDKCEVPNCLV